MWIRRGKERQREKAKRKLWVERPKKIRKSEKIGKKNMQ